MAIKIDNSSYYSNYQKFDTADATPYESRIDINIEKGGLMRLRSSSPDSPATEEEEVVIKTASMKELLPEYPQLKLNDLRITIRNLQGSAYALVYNRHDNELLKTIPHEDFIRKIGLMGQSQVTYFQIKG